MTSRRYFRLPCPITSLMIAMLVVLGSTRLGGQIYQVSGRITDAETGIPVETATVYMDGTSVGTITDPDGNFTLEGVNLPGRLIVSHVSYQISSHTLDEPTHLENLAISLNKKVVMLGEATIIHDLLRTEYVRRFKKWFLGMDYEEFRADILNDTVLIFNALENKGFSVQTTGPIIVTQPHTGYTIKIDLVSFSLKYREDLGGFHMSVLGFFFFEPVDPVSPRERRALARNRVKLFYNSGMHFRRSLYHNQLMQNGYMFQSACQPPEVDPYEENFLYDMQAQYIQDSYGNKVLYLTDFGCDKFRITYYHTTGFNPVDLTYLESRHVERSALQFLKDTIRIYPSGRIADNSMLFGGKIGRKGVASMLPDEYIPSMK